jgi:hypothetical protein
MFLLRLIWVVVRALFANRADLVAENLALRQQLAVLSRSTRRPRLRQRDRIFWVWLARCWSGWRDILIGRQTRDRGPLAPARLQVLLGLEEPTQGRPASH